MVLDPSRVREIRERFPGVNDIRALALSHEQLRLELERRDNEIKEIALELAQTGIDLNQMRQMMARYRRYRQGI